MALLTYLTTTHFDFGAVQTLPKVLSRAGISRPLITTDKGVVAAGILDTVQQVLGQEFPFAVYDETPGNPTEDATIAALRCINLPNAMVYWDWVVARQWILAKPLLCSQEVAANWRPTTHWQVATATSKTLLQ